LAGRRVALGGTLVLAVWDFVAFGRAARLGWNVAAGFSVTVVSAPQIGGWVVAPPKPLQQRK